MAMAVPSLSRAPDQRYEVTPLELFFNLVFVFAVSQLSHHFLEHLTWRGAAETLVMLIAVFGVWAYTSFEGHPRPAVTPSSADALAAVLWRAVHPRARASERTPQRFTSSRRDP
jgi:hypothetical protein